MSFSSSSSKVNEMRAKAARHNRVTPPFPSPFLPPFANWQHFLLDSQQNQQRARQLLGEQHGRHNSCRSRTIYPPPYSWIISRFFLHFLLLISLSPRLLWSIWRCSGSRFNRRWPRRPLMSTTPSTLSSLSASPYSLPLLFHSSLFHLVCPKADIWRRLRP